LTRIAGPDFRPATATPSVHSASLDEHVDIRTNGLQAGQGACPPLPSAPSFLTHDDDKVRTFVQHRQPLPFAPRYLTSTQISEKKMATSGPRCVLPHPPFILTQNAAPDVIQHVSQFQYHPNVPMSPPNQYYRAYVAGTACPGKTSHGPIDYVSNGATFEVI